MTDGFGIFNVHTHLGACHMHEWGSGTRKPAQELIYEGTERLSLTLPRHGIEPRVFGFEFRLSKPLSYVPLSQRDDHCFGAWFMSLLT